MSDPVTIELRGGDPHATIQQLARHLRRAQAAYLDDADVARKSPNGLHKAKGCEVFKAWAADAGAMAEELERRL